jgi:hypothetical protein
MQDNQIGPKIVGLDPANMARLPPSHNYKKNNILVVTRDYFYFEHALLYKGTRPFLTRKFSF